MRIKFKPMPGLTIVTLICLAILISLGTWQYQRLQWKTDLIAQIDIASKAPPFTSLADITSALDNGEPVDFRRIAVRGDFLPTTVNEGHGLHLMASDGKTMFWQVLQPLQQGSEAAYIVTGRFDNNADPIRPAAEKDTAIAGYVRLVRPASRFMPKSKPDQNQWYVFNGAPKQFNWADAAQGAKVNVQYYIDAVERNPQNGALAAAAALPVRKPELRNNHLDYMLTWYSFALILLIIYFMLHKKAGRLGVGGANA